MNDSSALAIWLPLLVSVPTSLVLKYISGTLSGTMESWLSIIAINTIPVLVVLYNIRQHRLVSLKEVPGRVWTIGLVAMLLLALFQVIFASK